MSEDKHNHIEKLITRKLDGILSAEEDLELNRAMISDPETHRMCEASVRVEATVARALEHVLGDDGELGFDPMELTGGASEAGGRALRRMWWLLPGAIAAGLAIFVSLAPIETPASSGLAELNGGAPVVDVAPAGSPLPLLAGARQVNHGAQAPRVQRDTTRDLLGVMGEDGRIYLFEVDRTRTIRRPDARYKTGQASEDF